MMDLTNFYERGMNMRKTISVIMSIVMIVSMLCVGISAAPAGTAIKDAAGFAAMDPTGDYYLAADITIDTTYATAFTGNFDGNSHTITTSVPLFAEVGGGSFKNLIIEGSIAVTGADVYAAALALRVTKNTVTTFENIVNKADVIGEYRAGGIVAQINASAAEDASTETTFTKCFNYGKVAGTSMVGGIVGYSQGAKTTFVDCVNMGDVSDSSGLAGGIIGRDAGDLKTGSSFFTITVTNCYNGGKISGTSNVGGIVGYMKSIVANVSGCVNVGEVSSTTNDAGGIVGHVGAKDYLATGNFTNCQNFGTINYTGENATGSAAGIVGYCYGSGSVGTVTIDGCANYGALNSTMFASHFVGYVNNLKAVIKNSIGAATITDDKYKVIVGCSSAGVSDGTLAYGFNFSGITLKTGDATDRFSYATAEANAGNIISIADYMTKCPGVITYSDVVVPQTPAAPTPALPESYGPSPSTGDNFVVYAVIAVVAVLGVAVVSKKKVND